MEALGNTSCYSITFFWFLINDMTNIEISFGHKFVKIGGIFFSILSIFFKLYLSKLSFNDYFEYEQFKRNKVKDFKKID